MTDRCDHKFVDSTICLKCGVSIETLREQNRREVEAYERRQRYLQGLQGDPAHGATPVPAVEHQPGNSGDPLPGQRTIPHTLQRWSIEMNGDDQIIERAPDGEWMRAEDVLPVLARLSDRDQLRDGLGRLAQELTAATAELTRWRAMFSTPDIAQRHIDQINAHLARIETTATANSALIERLLAVRAPVTPEEPGGQ